MDWSVLAVILKWFALAIGLAPMVLGIGIGVLEGSILPRRIAQAEIDGLADDIMRRYPADPEEAAFIEEYAAWHRSKSFEQGKWRRVQKEIRRRLINMASTDQCSRKSR